MTSPSSLDPSARGPLGGAGILVTRPARQAAGTAQRIAALGGEPFIFPAIVILPPLDTKALERAHAALAKYDGAIFVSANAVEYGAPDSRRWPSTLTPFAPGPGTAQAVADAGIPGTRIPSTSFDSEGLLALPELADVRGKRFIVFRGDGGREQLGDTLRARGAEVDYVACYRRAKPRGGIEGLDNLWEIVPASLRFAWRACPTFVPHERIAARARELGLATVETGAGDAGLLAGLLQWFAAHPIPTA
jgi:uroporphyrinogen-III synthase